MTSYKIYHSQSKVFVIAENDVPKPPMGLHSFSREYSAWERNIYEPALQTKGVEVTNASYAGGEIWFHHVTHMKAVENELYDLPTCFRVQISNRVDVGPVKEDKERVENKSGNYQVATLVRTSQPQPEESQDVLFEQMIELIETLTHNPSAIDIVKTLQNWESKFEIKRKPGSSPKVTMKYKFIFVLFAIVAIGATAFTPVPPTGDDVNIEALPTWLKVGNVVDVSTNGVLSKLTITQELVDNTIKGRNEAVTANLVWTHPCPDATQYIVGTPFCYCCYLWSGCRIAPCPPPNPN